jgi:hypothetical protein
VYESREVLDERMRKFVSEFLDDLPKPFPEGVQMGTIAFVAEMTRTDPETGEIETSEVWFRCSDRRPWIQAGLFEAAKRVAEFEDEDEDDRE